MQEDMPAAADLAMTGHFPVSWFPARSLHAVMEQTSSGEHGGGANPGFEASCAQPAKARNRSSKLGSASDLNVSYGESGIA